MSKKFLLALLVLLCAVSVTPSQTQSDDVVRITTNLVQVDAVVTKKGKLVIDLKADDFEIYEDGKLQTITSFAWVSNVSTNAAASGAPGTNAKDPNVAVDPNAPPPVPAEIAGRRIALVVDDYGLSAVSMAAVKRQLRKFIDEKLNRNDLVAIVLTSRVRREMPQLTNDKSRLNQALEHVKFNQCNRVGVKPMARAGDQGSVGCGPNVATFDDSIRSIRSVVAALGQLPGRKSLIVFSNDMPLREEEKLLYGSSSVVTAGPEDSTADDSNNYRGRLRSLGELAIRSSVVIYGIDAAGLQTIGMTAADQTLKPNIAGPSGNGVFTSQLREQTKMIQRRREGAEKLAKATGGFMVRDQNDFQLDKILDDQSGYYLIGYRPSTETFDKKFHKIRARVKQSGYEVRTRSGFFGMSEEEANRLKQAPTKK